MKRAVALLCVSVLLLPGCSVTPPVTEPVTETTASAGTTTTPTTTSTTAPSTTAAVETPTDPTTSAASTTVPIGTTAKTTAKTTVRTTAKTTTTDWRKNYDSLQLIRDPAFHNGLIIDSHEVKDNQFVPAGTWKFNDSKEAPCWDLNNSTWASYRDRSHYIDLFNNNISKVKTTISDGLHGMTYNAKNDSMIFHWDSYDWYGGEGHDPADSWPGLIASQGYFNNLTAFLMLDDEEQQFYRCDADKIILSLDIRMTRYEHEWYEGINCLQFLTYYYVKCARGGTGFIWFGVPLLDDRWADERVYFSDEEYFNIDPDSGCYVYCMPCKDVFACALPTGRADFFDEKLTTPEASDEWLHLEMDLRPWLEKMAALTIKGSANNTFPQARSTHDLYFDGLNIGYEVHGSYKCDFEVKNYALTAYIKK